MHNDAAIQIAKFYSKFTVINTQIFLAFCSRQEPLQTKPMQE